MGKMNINFEDKVVLVTGAAGGIGLASAVMFANAGATVIAMDLAGSPLSESISNLGDLAESIIQVEGNVTEIEDWRNTVDMALREYGGIDILLNNAGIAEPSTQLDDFEERWFDRVMAVNVKGTFLGMKMVLPAMRGRKGAAIINVSSISGYLGSATMIAYSASKHAVLGLTKSAALSYAEYGIRVNAVCPAPIDTPMMRKHEEELRVQKQDPNYDIEPVMTSIIPLNRFGKVEEVAAVISFLASDHASFMTGAGVPVDGGTLA